MEVNKPIVYLVHGLLETAHTQYQSLMTSLENEYMLIPIDLPGHGRCTYDASDDYIKLCVEYVSAIMRKFGRGHLISCSYLGGPVAIRTALNTPSSIRSLTLSGYVPDIPLPTFKTWINGFYLMARENQKVVKWYYDRHGDRWKQTLDAYHLVVIRSYMNDIYSDIPMINRIEAPIIVINGSEKSNELNAVKVLSRHVENLMGYIIEGGGHVPSSTHPEEFKAKLVSSWNSLELETENNYA
jgi:pimeloyl-ACP methyl ester carboxylesterase